MPKQAFLLTKEKISGPKNNLQSSTWACSQLCLYFNFSVKEPQNYKTPLLQLCIDTQACTIGAWSCLLYPNYPFTTEIHKRSVSRASMSDDLHGGLSLAQCTVNLLLSHPEPLVIDSTVMLLFSQSLVCGSLMSK